MCMGFSVFLLSPMIKFWISTFTILNLIYKVNTFVCVIIFTVLLSSYLCLYIYTFSLFPSSFPLYLHILLYLCPVYFLLLLSVLSIYVCFYLYIFSIFMLLLVLYPVFFFTCVSTVYLCFYLFPVSLL